MVSLLAHSLGIPQNFIAQILAPYLPDASRMGVNDVCVFFDVVSLYEENLDYY